MEAVEGEVPEIVVMAVGVKAEIGLASAEGDFERSNDVSGTKTIMKSTATAWITLTTISWFRNSSLDCERDPPRIGEPQVNVRLTIFKIVVRRPRSWTYPVLAGEI